MRHLRFIFLLFLFFGGGLALEPDDCQGQTFGQAQNSATFELTALGSGLTAEHQFLLETENTFSAGDGTATAMATPQAGATNFVVGDTFDVFANAGSTAVISGQGDGNAIAFSQITITNTTNASLDFTVNVNYDLMVNSFGNSQNAQDSSAFADLLISAGLDSLLDVSIQSLAFNNDGSVSEQGFINISQSIAPGESLTIDSLASGSANSFSSGVPEPGSAIVVLVISVGIIMHRRKS